LKGRESLEELSLTDLVNLGPGISIGLTLRRPGDLWEEVFLGFETY